MKKSNKCFELKRFLSDSCGGIMPAVAVTLPVILMAAAVTVQYTIASQSKSKMQQASDAALMAGAIEANKFDSLDDMAEVKAKLKENVDAFLEAGMISSPNIKYNVTDIEFDPVTKLATLKVSYTYPDFMKSIIGKDDKPSSVDTAIYLSTKEKKPISMYLVLDKSGSMDWDGRMVALKIAVGDLTTKMSTQDPDKKYVRMGAIAYDSNNHSHDVAMNWDPQSVNTYTQGLVAAGGTNSSGAMKSAYQALKGNKEELAHSAKNDGTPKKYILFLTDGANNASSYDTNTIKYCDRAKDEEIEIYSVAFQAPASAQALLKNCASTEGHYFKADSANDLIASFKTIGESATKALAFSK